MTLQEKAELAQNDVFRSKIQQAVFKAANYILADSDREFISHKYAEHVQKNVGGAWLNNFVNAVLGDDNINSESPDNDLQNTVNASFDKLAKIHYNNI